MKLLGDCLLVNLGYVISLSVGMNTSDKWCIAVKTTDSIEYKLHDFDKYEEAQEQLKKYSEEIFEV